MKKFCNRVIRYVFGNDDVWMLMLVLIVVSFGTGVTLGWVVL